MHMLSPLHAASLLELSYEAQVATRRRYSWQVVTRHLRGVGSYEAQEVSFHSASVVVRSPSTASVLRRRFLDDITDLWLEARSTSFLDPRSRGEGVRVCANSWLNSRFEVVSFVLMNICRNPQLVRTSLL
mgnify:CR=1 FL=1